MAAEEKTATVDAEVDWFGDSTPETIAKEKQRRSEEWARTKQRRAWMPPGGNEWEGIFLDDTPRTFNEHNLYMNGGRKGNWFTCIARLDDRSKEQLKPYWGGCPLCNVLNDSAYFIGLLTVLNVSGFTIESGQDRGKTIPMFRTMIALKMGGVEWVNREKRIRKSMIGGKYNFSRTDKNEPVYGTPTFIEKVDLNMDKFKYENKEHKILTPDPFDYKKVTAPLTYSRLMQIAEQVKRDKNKEDSSSSRGSGRGQSQGRSSGKGGDDAPFNDEAEAPGTGDDDIPF